MLLSEAISEYLAFAKYEQRISYRTHATYQSWLRHFEGWDRGTNGQPLIGVSLSTDNLRAYLHYQSARGIKPNSIKSTMYPIRAMCKYLRVNKKILKKDPFVGIVLPTIKDVQSFTTDEKNVVKIMKAVESFVPDRRRELARAILSVYVYAGLRRFELCNLKLSDVDVDKTNPNPFVYVREGKGGKSAKVYICEECAEAIRKWLAVREQDSTTDYIFTMNRAKRVHFETVYHILRDAKKIAGLEHETFSLHALRHAAATRLLANGVDIVTIQKFLRHNHLETTQIYLHTDDDRLKASVHAQSLSTKKTHVDKRGERVIRKAVFRR